MEMRPRIDRPPVFVVSGYKAEPGAKVALAAPGSETGTRLR
jgi:hypothetical protein